MIRKTKQKTILEETTGEGIKNPKPKHNNLKVGKKKMNKLAQ